MCKTAKYGAFFFPLKISSSLDPLTRKKQRNTEILLTWYRVKDLLFDCFELFSDIKIFDNYNPHDTISFGCWLRSNRAQNGGRIA